VGLGRDRPRDGHLRAQALKRRATLLRKVGPGNRCYCRLIAADLANALLTTAWKSGVDPGRRGKLARHMAWSGSQSWTSLDLQTLLKIGSSGRAASPTGPEAVKQRSTATSWTASGSEGLLSVADLPQRPRMSSPPRVSIEGLGALRPPVRCSCCRRGEHAGDENRRCHRWQTGRFRPGIGAVGPTAGERGQVRT
jgi:hypothetical protein